MGKIFADKTERHFDIDLSGLAPDEAKGRRRTYRPKGRREDEE
jgi:hypothetical protein